MAKADEWLADRLNRTGIPSPDGKGWNKTKVEAWRTENDLTWHHHEDMTTMQLIPEGINNYIRHIGGRTLKDEQFVPALPKRKP